MCLNYHVGPLVAIWYNVVEVEGEGKAGNPRVLTSVWGICDLVSTLNLQKSMHTQTSRECVLLEMSESNIDLSACTLTLNR